jgi:hypothetical protein
VEWGELALSPVGLKADGDLATGQGLSDRVLKDVVELAVEDLADPVLEVLALATVFLKCLEADFSKMVYGDLFMGLNSETLNAVLKLIDPRHDSLKSRKTLKSSSEGLD